MNILYKFRNWALKRNQIIFEMKEVRQLFGHISYEQQNSIYRTTIILYALSIGERKI